MIENLWNIVFFLLYVSRKPDYVWLEEIIKEKLFEFFNNAPNFLADFKSNFILKKLLFQSISCF